MDLALLGRRTSEVPTSLKTRIKNSCCVMSLLLKASHALNTAQDKCVLLGRCLDSQVAASQGEDRIWVRNLHYLPHIPLVITPELPLVAVTAPVPPAVISLVVHLVDLEVESLVRAYCGLVLINASALLVCLIARRRPHDFAGSIMTL